MILKKKFRNADKEIVQDKDFVEGSEGDAIINIKVDNDSQIFSRYNYESNEKLNPELSEFIYDKARFVPASKNIRLKIYSKENVDEKDVETAIKNNYKKDYIAVRNEIKRNLIFSISMLIAGIIFFAFLLVMHKYFYNAYLGIIVEIITWVFIWEAVDAFFLQRLRLKHKRNVLLNLYTSQIDVIFIENKKLG